MIDISSVILAGDGWGAIAAAQSLKKVFNRVFIISGDKNVLNLFGSEYIISDFETIKYDLVICAGYKPFINKKYTDTGKFINIHYSLLPTYRGLHSTVWAILNNEEYLGLSIHLMNEYMDDGLIIYQFSIKNNLSSTSAYYMDKFNKHIENHLGEIVLRYVGGKIEPIKQDKSLASWVGKRSVEDCRINSNKPISYQKAFFRALVEPYPLPFFDYKGQRFYPNCVKYQEVKLTTHIGRILNIDNEGVWIKVLDGYMIFDLIRNTGGDIVDKSYFSIGRFIK